MNPLSAPMMATRLSRSSAEQKVRVVQLYRQLLRQVPWIKSTHDLPHTHSQLRATVNSHFRRNIAITDPGVVDLLIFKGKTEYDEIVMQYKQRSHIQRLIEEPSGFSFGWGTVGGGAARASIGEQ